MCEIQVRNREENHMAFLGYARDSTDGQTLEAQVSELQAAGARSVFQEKVSGAVTERAPN
jgi:DNA invertase Pin-like site-specific DNA recombinase